MKYIITLIFLITVLNSIAQKRQNVYYFKENGKSVKEKDSADFIRIIREPDSGMVNYELLEYYRNGKIKRIGNVSSFSPNLVLDGYCIKYYPSGNKEQMGFYQRNLRLGEFKSYYSNNILMEKRVFKVATSDYDSFDKGIVTYLADSLGKSFLDSTGTGEFKIISSNGSYKQGFYNNGLKDGLWRIFDAVDHFTLEETYQLGKFIKGVRIENDGKLFNYASKDILPTFPGGNSAFGEFLTQNLKYPKDAKDFKIQGRVLVSFVVDKDGSLTNLNVKQGIGGGCDEEALRVMSRSPKWNPGMQNGKFVKVLFMIPIYFKLNEITEFPDSFGTKSYKP